MVDAHLGAVFVEVRLDEDFMIPRVTRAVAVYGAGRIIKLTTARSQMIGGLIWGVGQALLEHSDMDPRLGRYVSKNLAGYLVPVTPTFLTSMCDSWMSTTHTRAPSAHAASASCRQSASVRRSPMPCGTRPVSASGSSRSDPSIC